MQVPSAFPRSDAVQKWIEAHGRHWNTAVDTSVTTHRLEVLQRFCAFCEVDPDELVRSLFRETPEGRRIRLRRRREVMARIEAFERQEGDGDVRLGREAGNIVRSFLIHNGVALTASPLR